MSAVREWGTTEAERAAPYPCDHVIPEITKEWWRGSDIDAPPETVFRWLCQLRKAPYSYDLLDNFGRRSPRTLTPGLEHLETGQKFMIMYELAEYEPDRSITINLKKFVWMFGARAVSYVITPVEGGCRLVAKVRLKKPPLPFGLTVPYVLPVLDLIMMRKQMRTLRKLMEAGA